MSETSDPKEAVPTTERRKREHIETVLNADVTAKGVSTGFERYFFEHCALPELALDDIDLSTQVFGKTLKVPILISSMTGGTERAGEINYNLAMAAQQCGAAMGLGSQRAVIEDASLASSYQVRDTAPDILLFANLGAVQLNYGYGLDEARQAVEMIGADALFLHLNPLQESVQPEGDQDWRNLYRGIEEITGKLDVPVIAKEVGNGISASVAKRLVDCGVAGIDVAGAGGTSWSEVEANRQSDPDIRAVAHAFAGWGIPTALSLINVKNACPKVPVIASGGIRNGIEMAKAIRLGAALCGIAAPALGDAVSNSDAVIARLSGLARELQIAAFCTGSGNLDALRRSPLRRTDDWSIVES